MEHEDVVEIAACALREQCAELALVLESQSIPSTTHWNGHAWVLSVSAAAAPTARRELSAYAAEYAARKRSVHAPIPQIGNAWPGIVVYAVVLLGLAVLAPNLGFGIDWLARGRMDAGAMLAGEWWRPITALTLHADAAHVLGNLFFGALFAFSLTRYWGGGFGWLAIVVCGMLGNVANGILSGPDHRSIGASTAVFAALGLVAAYCFRRGFPVWASTRERSAPLVAALGLLAWMGTGGVNTDLGAHLLGFAVGIAGGLLVAHVGVPSGRRAQMLSAIVAASLVAGAWLAAIV
jgi:membrane associated rhomboid family serine protease